MNAFLSALADGAVLADGGIGSLIFERTGRLSEPGRVYEAFNIDEPELVSRVHLAYLQAGAQCLTTNSYEANLTHMRALGEGHRIREINLAAVKVARDAAIQFAAESGSEAPVYVLGSCGPTATSTESASEVHMAYREQIDALVEGGVDALLLETFTELSHLVALLELIAELPQRPPVITQMALHHNEATDAWSQDPRIFVKTMAERGANVIGVNACAPWEAAAFIDAVRDVDGITSGKVFLSAIPNAGRIDLTSHRFMTGVNAEIMGRFARAAADQGVRLIGGCSEVHPPFIREMHNYLQSRRAGRARQSQPVIELTQALPPPSREDKRSNGPFSKKLFSNEFAVSVELLPSRGTSASVLASKVSFVRELAASGLADALDVTDGSRGIPLIPPGDFIHALRGALGWSTETGDALELIPHVTGRDLNIMGMQSRMIGYHATHIHNLLMITGDPPKMSPTYPRSTAVFDVNSVDLIRYAARFLNAGIDFGGQPLSKTGDPRTHFTVGTGFEPESVNMERECAKLDQKLEAGADYVMTQPAYRWEPLQVLEPYRERVPILVGVLLLTGLQQAKRVGAVPGVVVPSGIYDRLGAYDQMEDQARVGLDIAIEQVRRIRADGWGGLYMMSPGKHSPLIDVLRAGLS